MLRTRIKDIPRYSRATRGVTVMKLKGDDVVASVEVLEPKDSEPGLTAENDDVETVTESTIEPTISGIPTNGHGE